MFRVNIYVLQRAVTYFADQWRASVAQTPEAIGIGSNWGSKDAPDRYVDYLRGMSDVPTARHT